MSWFGSSPEKALKEAMVRAMRSEDAGTPMNISELEYGELRDATLNFVRRQGAARQEAKSKFISSARMLIAGRGGGSPVRLLVDCLFDGSSYGDFKSQAEIF